MGQKYTDIWISIGFFLFFWVPLVNLLIVFPVSLYYALKAILFARKKPKDFLKLILGLILTVSNLVSFTIGVVVFLGSTTNITFSVVWTIVSISFCLFLVGKLRKFY